MNSQLNSMYDKAFQLWPSMLTIEHRAWVGAALTEFFTEVRVQEKIEAAFEDGYDHGRYD